MTRFRLANAAAEDLSEIHSSTAETSTGKADRLLNRLYSKFLLLADHPGIGTRMEALGRGLRCFTVRPYVVFFRPIDDGVAIVRVLHGARDIGPDFFDDQ